MNPLLQCCLEEKTPESRAVYADWLEENPTPQNTKWAREIRSIDSATSLDVLTYFSTQIYKPRFYLTLLAELVRIVTAPPLMGRLDEMLLRLVNNALGGVGHEQIIDELQNVMTYANHQLQTSLGYGLNSLPDVHYHRVCELSCIMVREVYADPPSNDYQFQSVFNHILETAQQLPKTKNYQYLIYLRCQELITFQGKRLWTVGANDA